LKKIIDQQANEYMSMKDKSKLLHKQQTVAVEPANAIFDDGRDQTLDTEESLTNKKQRQQQF
jgi:hypothetical protein